MTMASVRSNSSRIGIVASLLLYAGALPAGPPVSTTSKAPRDWAVETATNEAAVLRHKDSYLRYRMRLIDSKGDQTRDVIESKDGAVARLILRDGRPLTPREDVAERSRLDDLAASPASFFKHIKNEDTGKKLAEDLLAMMPDAMIFAYTPGQPPSAPTGVAPEVVLDFHPNPAWNPPTLASQALTGLEGRLWIDAKAHQMIRMEVHIFKPVNFGWGMLAHVYPGGSLLLTQTDAGGDRWIFSNFTQEVSVRALMVKQMNVHAEVSSSAYRAIGPMPYQEAIRALLDTPLPSN